MRRYSVQNKGGLSAAKGDKYASSQVSIYYLGLVPVPVQLISYDPIASPYDYS